MTPQPNKCITERSNNYLEILETSWCPFPIIIQVWSELIMLECRWSFLLINTAIELFPAPSLTNARVKWWMWLFWCLDPRLTLLNWSLRSSWDWELNCPLGFWCRAFNDLCSLSTRTLFVICGGQSQLQYNFFVLCRFGKLFVVLGCETFEFLMTLEALNFVLFYWLAPN